MIIGHSATDREKIRGIIKKRGFKVYFIGIGGISMSSIAEISAMRGARVFGSDVRKNAATEKLENMGVRIKYTQARANVMESAADIAVYSLSITSDNPEYRAAMALGIPLVSRAEYLGALMDDYGVRIGVSGSHGKSTTTAMLGEIFRAVGASPSVLCGAEISSGTGYVRGERDCLVYEACEYGDSFLHFDPTVQIILNVDLDHTDYFSDIERLGASFVKAANRAEKFVLANLDDANVRRIIPSIVAEKVTFSSERDADFRYKVLSVSNGRCSFGLSYGMENCSFSLKVPGRFNVENAVAAAAAALKLGVPQNTVADALSNFRGIPRRLEFLCKKRSADIYYDYAHHPSEIKATHTALCAMGYKKICAVFAPHTYSRTKSFLGDFAKALVGFNTVYVTDIYGARENAVVGISSSLIADAVRDEGGLAYALVTEESIDKIFEDGYDCLVLMGAGELDKIKKKAEEL